MYFKQNECYENIQCLIYQTTYLKEKTNILRICQKKNLNLKMLLSLGKLQTETTN